MIDVKASGHTNAFTLTDTHKKTIDLWILVHVHWPPAILELKLASVKLGMMKWEYERLKKHHTCINYKLLPTPIREWLQSILVHRSSDSLTNALNTSDFISTNIYMYICNQWCECNSSRKLWFCKFSVPNVHYYTCSTLDNEFLQSNV